MSARNPRSILLRAGVCIFGSRSRKSQDGALRPGPGSQVSRAAFVERPGRVLSRDMLIDLARGSDAEPYDRAIDIAVSRLRRKLAEADPATLIETVRGAGYRFAPSVRRE